MPFAHLVREGVYSGEMYAKLAAAFPTPDRFVTGSNNNSNQAIRIAAVDVIGNPEFDPLWQEFFRYHTSRQFWLELVALMGDEIRITHPNLESMFGKKLEDFVVTVRGSKQSGDVTLDTLFVVNTPVRKESSVRPPHVDSENEIFAGLFYMRSDDDTTGGGDLSLYHFKSPPRFGAHYAEMSDLVEDKKISYAPNRLVTFVNSEHSVHGVTPRPPTDAYRRYINMIAVARQNVFELPRLPLPRRFSFWVKRRLSNKPRGALAKKK